MTPRLQSFFGLACAWLLAASPSPAQEPAFEQQPQPAEQQRDDSPQDLPEDEPAENVLPPEEPMTPREELFLAIELKDLEAARGALRRGADGEISSGETTPLATAALHNDLRMVVLLLDAGGDPNATSDSPLEEAIRNENIRMVELFMRSGAQVPAGATGQQLFWLAQRGDAAQELSRILLDHEADAGQCLAAATTRARADLMKYCLSRGADAGSLPAEMSILGVALASGDAELVDLILAGSAVEQMLRGAFTDAVAAGRMDLVQRALAVGAVPAFEQVEAAIENGHPDICLFLLDQSAAEDPPVLRGGDAAALIQRAGDLGYAEAAAALRSKSGLSAWTAVMEWLPLALSGLLIVVLSGLLVSSLLRRRGKRPPARAADPSAYPPAGARPAAGAPARTESGAMPAGEPPPAADAPAAVPASTVHPAGRAAKVANPAATLPVGAIPMMPSVPPGPEASMPAAPVRAVPPAPVVPPAVAPAAVLPAPVVPAAVAPAAVPPAPVAAPAATPPIAATAAVGPASPDVPTAAAPATAAPQAVAVGGTSDVWHLAPEPVAEAPVVPTAGRVAAAAAAQPAVELRMPEVDLSRDADAVFEAARSASSGETVRPDAPDRRQVVLVTPSRVTMLRSCPAAGSLAPEQLAAAMELAGPLPARNVAVIGYTDLDAMGDDITQAIPFFELLRKLGYLGHAVWIFEGHVSAMAAGCRDADVLIVDDGMMPYLPGNWRSVATRTMRGSEIHVFERKTGSLRHLT